VIRDIRAEPILDHHHKIGAGSFGVQAQPRDFDRLRAKYVTRVIRAIRELLRHLFDR